MPTIPSPVLRAMEGLAESSGRTVVIAGPPMSGKSDLLEEVLGLLRARGARSVELRGSYRGRSIPYGALDGLRTEPELASIFPGTDGENRDDPAAPVLAPVPYLADRLPRGRRSRGERPRMTFLGQPIRGRSANEGDPDAYWQEILPEFRGPEAHAVGLVIDDGSLFDAESREFIVSLSRRARLRPLLIVIALDTSVPGFVAWEEAFLGRGDVDWVRFEGSAPDPREAHRVKGIYDDLPSATRKVAGFVALLGGTVGEVVLSRISRLTFPQMAEAILPASGVGLLKVQEGKVTIPQPAWVPLTVDLIPESQRREMHLEIADALSALSPEPSLARRVEVARHYLAWSPGPMALRRLLDAAELSLQLLAFDSSEDLLREAISCLTALPPAERDAIEPELRLLHARALFSAGRPIEAEVELQQGIGGGIRARLPAESLTEWVEPLLLTMRAVGPRPSLATTLTELAERCHDAELVEVEVLLEALVAEYHFERNQPEKARAEAHRAALLARRLPEGHLQGLALLAVGLSRIEGSEEEQAYGERFLEAARLLLGRARRWQLDALAEELVARLLEARGERQRAREIRERSIPVVQRARLLPVEIYHQLGVAETLLDRENPRGVEAFLDRSRLISETLHLLPPSPALLHLWLLEGRWAALGGNVLEARDRWEALVDAPSEASVPRIRAEALVRLVLLEHGRSPDRAAELERRLADPDIASALPTAWASWIPEIATRAPRSGNGGGSLPPPAGPPTSVTSERREHSRRESVRDRGRAHQG